MSTAALLGLPVAVHAESESLTGALARELRASGGTSARDYLASRPIVAETEAVGRALLFAQETGCDLHFVHLSSARAVALVTEARLRGVRATCETCPHYLHFTDEDLERLGAVLKCAPPLRSDDERHALWQALLRGEIDLVASDHSPSEPALKEREDFFEVWGGISGSTVDFKRAPEPPRRARLATAKGGRSDLCKSRRTVPVTAQGAGSSPVTTPTCAWST